MSDDRLERAMAVLHGVRAKLRPTGMHVGIAIKPEDVDALDMATADLRALFAELRTESELREMLDMALLIGNTRREMGLTTQRRLWIDAIISERKKAKAVKP